MSSDEQCEKECPLCMEPLEIDDIDFYPCKCEYQICRFCWHRLRTDENGLCPACRQPYPENPVNFKPLSTSEVLKIKSEKKQKALQQRNKISESRKHLAAYRVLQKNLVYVVGLSSRVADPEILKKPEFFGKFGKILKIAVGSSANAPQSASCTAYVTYAKFEDALKAIQAVNNALLDGRTVRASLGTTKYCSSFLRGQTCNKPECMYLHSVADSEVSFTKEDMHLGRHTEYERKLIEATLSKDKGLGEKINLPLNFRRKHSHSNSRDRSGTLHTVSSTGALERGYGKNSLSHQKQQSRTASKSRSETPNFGILSATLSNSEKTVNHIDVPEKIASRKDPFVKTSTTMAKAQSTLVNGEKKLDISVKKHLVENSKLFKRDADCKVEDHPEMSNYGSRLSRWTSPEGEEEGSTKCKKRETAPKTVSWSENEINEGSLYRKETTTINGFDWQRLLGLNLNENRACNVKDAEFTEKGVQCAEVASCRRSHLSAHSDDDLGFDPATESFKGLADLIAKETASEIPLQSAFKAPAPPSSLFTMGQQFGWSSVTGTGDVLRTSVENDFSLLPEHPTVNNCATSTDYLSFSPIRFSAAGQPVSHQLHNVSASQHMIPFSGTVSKPALLKNQFTDPPPTISSRYSQHKFPSFNQGTPLSSLAGQSAVSPGTSQLSEWQEGLKAMLPNVNVRFVQELNPPGYPTTTRQALTAQTSWIVSNQPSSQLVNHHQQQQSSLHNFYGQPSSSQSHHLITSATNTQVPIMSLNSISQGAPPQWLLPPPGFSHLSKR